MRSKNVNPFLQAGINHETNFIGRSHSGVNTSPAIPFDQERGGSFFYRLSANLGVGLSVKLSSKFKVELKYDLYRSIIRTMDSFTSFSVLGGIKYNL